MFEIDHCPSCGSRENKKLKEHLFRFPGDDVQNQLHDLTYERLWIFFERILEKRDKAVFLSMLCQKCGLIFTNPRFSREDIQIKYEAVNELGSVKYRLKQHPPSHLDVRARRIYHLVTNHLSSRAESKPRVLDYGGASGYNVLPFTDKFACGVLDFEQWDLPRGISYLGRDLSDLREDDRFEVILLLHTLEHIPEPSTFLEDIGKYLANEGVIYVEVPLGCFREWRSITEPLTHINFFSEESLFNCINSCGLATIHLETCYQWVTHGNMWCVNAVGKKENFNDKVIPNLTTKEQMNKVNYYLPFLRDGGVIRSVLKKMTGKRS